MPSIRHTEIKARRARKKKMTKLRERFANGTATEKEKVLEKVAKIAPWITADEFKNMAKA